MHPLAHILAGALVGQVSSSPVGALLGGLASHVVLDAAPHTEGLTFKNPPAASGASAVPDPALPLLDRLRSLLPEWTAAGLEAVIGVLAVSWLARACPEAKVPLIAMGILGALLPDLIDQPLLALLGVVVLHIRRLHGTVGRRYALWGILSQAAVVGLVALALWQAADCGAPPPPARAGQAAVDQTAIQSGQAAGDEAAVQQALREALGRYFEAGSVLNISLAGVAGAGGSISIGDLLITVNPAVVRGFQAEVLLHVQGLRLDASALARRELEVLAFDRATVVGRSNAEQVAAGLARTSPAIRNPVVRFQAGEFEVTATVEREGALYPVRIRGRPVVEEGRRVLAALTQVQVSGGDVPAALVQRELARINPLLDLSQWPLNLRVERLVLHNDTMELLLAGQGG
ncbi:MAG: hypothetical protein QN175_12450 [Armatimonadota bacterium]|nr:hypothetical protein [Armatimonadota bacterium]MDR7475804.1 hypothetical protein [Armatimonadota bacterium]